MEDNQKYYKLCDVCKNQATSLCLDCLFINYYCDSCYKIAHDKKEYNNHKKEKIDYYVPIETKCPEHQNVPLNLFCLEEKGNIFNLIIYRIMLLNLSFLKYS